MDENVINHVDSEANKVADNVSRGGAARSWLCIQWSLHCVKHEKIKKGVDVLLIAAS